MYVCVFLWCLYRCSEEEKEKRHVSLGQSHCTYEKFLVFGIFPTSSLGTIPRPPFYYFCYSFLPDITCNLLLPSCADIFSSILCQELCHSKSFLYTPVQIILFSSFSQSHSFVSSLPGNCHYKNTEIMNRTELWEWLLEGVNKAQSGWKWTKWLMEEEDKLSKHSSSSPEGANSCYQSGLSSSDYRGEMFTC